MFNSARRLQLAALATLSLLPTLAAAADYTYVEGGFLFRHDYGSEAGGGRAAGSLDLPLLPLAIIAEYDGTGHLSQFDAGAIFHLPIAPGFSVFGGATLEHADNYSSSDTGAGLRGGIRWRAASTVELSPEFRYIHLYHRDQASVRLNGLLNIAPHLDLQGAVQVGDDQRYEVGVRYSFDSAL
jgi:hypothetical protein